MTPAETRAALAEAMARGMCKQRGTSQCAAICLSRFYSDNRNGKCPDAPRVWKHETRAALDALSAKLRELGLKIVPIEATEEMREAGGNVEHFGWRRVYASMLAAAPDVLGGPDAD